MLAPRVYTAELAAVARGIFPLVPPLEFTAVRRGVMFRDTTLLWCSNGNFGVYPIPRTSNGEAHSCHGVSRLQADISTHRLQLGRPLHMPGAS